MKKTILIVDDFENTLYVTGMTLQQYGFNIIKANSAKEAFPHLMNKVDLIITDYHMPEMDGLQFIDKVKEMPEYENIPVFMLSTEVSPKIIELAYSKGITVWVKKPYNMKELRELVAKVLK